MDNDPFTEDPGEAIGLYGCIACAFVDESMQTACETGECPIYDTSNIKKMGD